MGLFKRMLHGKRISSSGSRYLALLRSYMYRPTPQGHPSMQIVKRLRFILRKNATALRACRDQLSTGDNGDFSASDPIDGRAIRRLTPDRTNTTMENNHLGTNLSSMSPTCDDGSRGSIWHCDCRTCRRSRTSASENARCS
jgi:hypothetical protein